MKKISLLLTISFAIVAFIMGLTAGFYIAPEYQQTMYEKEAMGLGVADKNVDLRYINAMIAHHRGAILLADQVVKNSKRLELHQLALEIQTNEPKLIDELYQWKSDWYNDTRIVKDPVVANLGPADENFDLRFLNALIAHHEAGIEMTKEVRSKSTRSEVLANADAVESFLTESLVGIKQQRAEWFTNN